MSLLPQRRRATKGSARVRRVPIFELPPERIEEITAHAVTLVDSECSVEAECSAEKPRRKIGVPLLRRKPGGLSEGGAERLARDMSNFVTGRDERILEVKGEMSRLSSSELEDQARQTFAEGKEALSDRSPQEHFAEAAALFGAAALAYTREQAEK
jgi:hypothetical protein